jgi:DNA-binding transcriptional ArsR family regulator
MAPMAAFDCISVMKALGEPTRVRIMRLLLKDRLSVSQIVEKTGVSQYNVSKHLRILRQAGLLESGVDGKHHFFSVPPGLKRQLSENEATLVLDCCSFRFDKFS